MPHFPHAAIAAKLLREAAAFYRQTGERDATLAAHMVLSADIAEQAAVMIETDPTGRANRWPRSSLESGESPYTRIDELRNGYGGMMIKRPPPRPKVIYNQVFRYPTSDNGQRTNRYHAFARRILRRIAIFQGIRSD